MNSVCIERRQALREATKLAVVVVAGNVAVQKNNDTAFPFAQDGHFLYLTGINEPGWRLVMTPEADILVKPVRSEAGVVFDGELSEDAAKDMSGVAQVISSRQMSRLLRELAAQYDTVGAIGPDPRRRHYEFVLNPAQPKQWAALQKQFREVVDIRRDLSRLRAVKTDAEINEIRRAIKVTAEAFESAKANLAHMKYEYELEAQFTHYFVSRGYAHAYEPIVAGAGNACTLHYVKNNQPLPTSGLVLIDIGAQVGHYCADITRTLAVGTPTARQRQVHAAVVDAQRRIVALLRPGLAFKEYQREADAVMVEALRGLGLYKDETSLYRYMPHAVSHGLGVDVHDSLGGYTDFRSGMVITVEPGIYIPEESIGVRIEDDILITDDGYENLSIGLSATL